jgi:hypothetical protein
LINDKIVHQVILTKPKGKLVSRIDQNHRKKKLVIRKNYLLNASAINLRRGSAMQSKSKTHSNGIWAMRSLGRTSWITTAAGANGSWEGNEDSYYYGRRPVGFTYHGHSIGVAT